MNGEYINYKNYSMILGNLQLPDLPKELEVSGDKFIVKGEFHITLINLERNAKIIGEGDPQELKTKLANSFYDYVRQSPLSHYELANDLRLVNVDGNKTIIVLVKLEGIDKFFDWLNKKYGAEIPVQPAHITLYTLPTDTFGIPINSRQQLEEISKPIELPEIKKILGF